ncbi:MAG: lysylphosphatidylglycerol synthase transmembrane domain-containing protein [Thermoplasmatota archaeon]
MVHLSRLRRLKLLLPFVGISIFVYLVYSVGVGDIVETLATINPLFFMVSLSIFIPRIVISTRRWQLVARRQGIDVDLATLIKINLIGLFYGTVTPLWVGDWIRMPYLREESAAPLGTCASNVVLDQMMEFVALFALALVGSVVLLPRYPLFFVAFSALLVVVVAVVLYFREKNRSLRLLRLVSRVLIPERYREPVFREFHAFYGRLPRVSSLVVPFILGFVSYVLFFVQIYLVALSFDFSVPLVDFVLIYPVAVLIGLIPITVSGFGTREGVLITLLGVYGVAREVAVAISLSGYIVTLFIPAIVGGIFSVTWEARKQVTKV